MATQVSSTEPVSTAAGKNPSSSPTGKQTGPTYGGMCMVCNDIAPTTSAFRRHYGVICCEACKCFFRRTVQMGREYKCRFGNSCPVGRNAVSMKQVCQACRFGQCIRSGMKMDSVKKFPRKLKDIPEPSTTKSKEKPGKTSKKRSSLDSSNQNGNETSLVTSEIHSINEQVSQAQTNSGNLSDSDIKSEKLTESDIDFESDLEQFKFSIASPDLKLYSTVLDSPLFGGESIENIHENCSTPMSQPSRVGTLGEGGSNGSILSSSRDAPVISGSNASVSQLPAIRQGLVSQPSPLLRKTTMPISVLSNSSTSFVAPPATVRTTPQSNHIIAQISSLVNNSQSLPQQQQQHPMVTIVPSSNKRSISGASISELLVKRQRLEAALSNLTARQAQLNQSLAATAVAASTDPSTLTLPPTSIALPNSVPPLLHFSPGSSQSTAGILSSPTVTSPGCPSNYTSHNPTPYATPHGTPHGTPCPSPLPSPQSLPKMHTHHSMGSPYQQPGQVQASSLLNIPQAHNLSQPGTPVNHSRPDSPTNYGSAPPSISGHTHFQSNSNTGGSDSQMLVPNYHRGPAFLFPGGQIRSMQFYQTPMLVQLSQSFSQNPVNQVSSGRSSGMSEQSPFSSLVFPIPQLSTGLPSGSNNTSPKKDDDTSLPSPSIAMDKEGKLTVKVPDDVPDPELILTPRGPLSAPTSACPSPVPRSRCLADDAPEAEVDEVLDSLRLRIRHMFRWAKSEVCGFEDLSPLDQKALLRRTVSELVMLGFARASIPYAGMLLLGSTGKVMRTSNRNSGVATVAAVTIAKLVAPLRVLNMDDNELLLMKEIVLFNPESSGLRSREAVRSFRRRKHMELLEYTEKSSEPGRFGDLMCLLTPLYEVSQEVTEQLRLEQFVNEGEARIDALLLMSMINQGGGSAEEPMEAVVNN